MIQRLRAQPIMWEGKHGVRNMGIVHTVSTGRGQRGMNADTQLLLFIQFGTLAYGRVGLWPTFKVAFHLN